ncbi:homeodomain-interacting protein kinase 3-like [Hippoglossus stenolepis]|uniref:homeodomain-interacting protein kinase 3-like n=1 Tax=Hippoglossus stenolepis TaxID=195615 RepID=UPI001FAFDF35|nr:homeodomain-interacting protein kinase 3-like [Hippoglossus stenolepis]
MGRPLFPAYNETDLWNQILYTVGQHCFWPKYWMEWRFRASFHIVNGVDDNAERIDLAWFIDLLKRMLTLKPIERITPRGILEHPFITMSHLEGPFRNSLYVKSSLDVMSSCQDKKSDDGVDGDQKILPKSRNKESSNRTANPPTSQRKRDGPTLDDQPSGNKRKMRLKKELTDILKAMNNPVQLDPSSLPRLLC